MRRTLILTALLGVAILTGHADQSRAADAAALATAAARVAVPQVLVIAHRGDSKVAPENTLPAFTSAVDAGADLVELDYYHSADGVPVVFHDETLDRTTNACQLWGGTKIKLESKTAADLRTLDAGKWFAPKFAGTHLPTLDESIDAIQRGSMTLIERKGGEPSTCVELLKQKGLLDRVVVQAFDWDYLEGCHALAPDLVMAALGHKEMTAARLDDIQRTGAKVIAWEDKNTNASTIEEVHRRGYKAWVWTVDDPKRVAELVNAKIDGIITNVPAQTRAAVLKAQGR